MITVIAAVGKNMELGANGKMPWHLRGDLRFFREQTIGQTVIMGRKTFCAIGRPLQWRTNIIISRNTNIKIPGACIVNSLGNAINSAQNVFVIGGGEIYRQSINIADCITLTEIDKEYPNADTFFPEFDKGLFNKTVLKQEIENNTKYQFVKYTRIR